jgi:hypothetical protein
VLFGPTATSAEVPMVEETVIVALAGFCSEVAVTVA